MQRKSTPQGNSKQCGFWDSAEGVVTRLTPAQVAEGVARIKTAIAYRWVPRCRSCSRPLDETGICWFHSP